MTQLSDALWLTVSPAFKGFNRPLLKHLCHHMTIAQWEYTQTQDEPISLDVALVLLHDYLKHQDHPVHLLGHSTGGLLGLLYARCHPERVKSLTLLSVGVHPAVDWQAHYYAQLQKLTCSRETLLTQSVYNIFGHQSRPMIKELSRTLDRDLITSLSPHTLHRTVRILPGGVPVPLLVCGSQDDIIIDPNLLQAWKPWLKESDCLWQCPSGRYFFHYFYPQQVSEQIMKFWYAQPLFRSFSNSLDPSNITA